MKEEGKVGWVGGCKATGFMIITLSPPPPYRNINLVDGRTGQA